MAPISKGRWLDRSWWNGVASVLMTACAEATRAAESRRARTQTVAVARRCILLVNLYLRRLRLSADRRKPPVNGGRLRLATEGLVTGADHGGFVEVEVGVDVLRVVEVLEDFEETDHGVGLRAFEFGVGRGDLGDLGVLGGDLCGLEGFGDGLEILGIGEDFPVFAFVGEVFGAGVEDDFGQLVFAGGGFGDRDDAFLGEHPGDCAFGSEVAAVLGEGVADFAYGAIFIVGEDLDDDGYAAGAVALVGDLLVGEAFEFAGTALDGSLDVVGGHVLSFGGSDGSAEAGVAVGVSSALLGGDGDFLDKAGEDLAAFGVEGALF